MVNDVRPSDSAKRRLAIVAPSAYVLGGVQTWLDDIVPGLEQQGWQVTVLLVHGDQCDGLRYLRVHPFSRFRLVSNVTGSREGRIRALRLAITDVRAELVLSVNIVDTYEAVSRQRKKSGDPVRVVTALHGLSSCFYEDLLEWSEVIDGVVATNRLAAAAAVNWSHIAADRVHYAPCGVDVPANTAEDVDGNRRSLLFAGRFDVEEKRVLDLPGILRALELRGLDFTLRLAGAGPAEGLLRQALSEFGGRVEFVGELDANTLRTSFFRPGAIALVLSPRETGPLVAFEAMACGAAVATSRFVGIGLEGSLRHGETCVTFETGNVEDAADAIASLSDLGVRRLIARAGRDLVKRRYSQPSSISAWDAALRSVWESAPMPACPRPIEAPPTGRLDRLFGVQAAESVRRTIRSGFRHRAPGDEWPHSYGGRRDAQFLEYLTMLDRSGSRQPVESLTVGH